MRRKVVVAAVAILAALSLTGVAFASQLAIGRVIAVDPSAKTLTINAQGQKITCSVVENAAKDLADLKPGDKVIISFTVGDGNRSLCNEVFSWPTGG